MPFSWWCRALLKKKKQKHEFTLSRKKYKKIDFQVTYLKKIFLTVFPDRFSEKKFLLRFSWKKYFCLITWQKWGFLLFIPFKSPVSFLFFSPVDCPEQRVVHPLSAVAPEVVRVYGPDHDPGGAPLGCEAGLGLDALHVVVGDPLEALVHVGGGVVGVPLLGPLRKRRKFRILRMHSISR